ncbi:MAG: hypothetical protein BGN85_07055 [Alphaproteobacteria bacterium 64-11]|nr:MAG: hypothetical protein BGN85_07055 [Alphaproteobacteria bacterium 64-11]
MISLEDCIAMCGLNAAEVAAIAEHEHLPDIVAAELGSYLLHRAHGSEIIRQMLVDDIRASLAAGDNRHAALLVSALRHFLSQHPEASSTGADAETDHGTASVRET